MCSWSRILVETSIAETPLQALTNEANGFMGNKVRADILAYISFLDTYQFCCFSQREKQVQIMNFYCSHVRMIMPTFLLFL